MKLPSIEATKGTLGPTYLGFSLLAPSCTMLGAGLAVSLNWSLVAMLCVFSWVTYTIGHCVHDLGHATSERITLPRKWLKVAIFILALVSTGFVVYFTITVSLWILAFAAAIPLSVIYRKDLIYSPFSCSGGLGVCCLGGYFVMTESICLAPIMMSLFVFLFIQGCITLYQIDEWAVEEVSGKSLKTMKTISKKSYDRVIGCIRLMAMALIPLIISLLCS